MALWDSEGGDVSTALCTSRRTSIELFPALDRLLSERGWTVADLDAVALALGPGSFTGARVGISAVKGLCGARALPIAAIGTLDAVALASGCVGMVAACLDAKRGELYARLFECDGTGALEPRTDEILTTPAEWAQALAEHGPLWVVGEGAIVHRDALSAAFGSRARLSTTPALTSVAAVARWGARCVAEGHTVSARDLFPRYLRRAAAEINWERGLVGTRRRLIVGQGPAPHA